jgi:glucose-6-phosphate dehydrogenase assembly protein OpcA
VADAVAVDTWDGRGVRLNEVTEALAALRQQSTERSSTRTAVMTLVVVATTDEQAYAAAGALHALGGHHPARILVVRPDPDQVAALDARATLYSAQADGHAVNFEELTLWVGGQAALHLDSLVEAFTLADLPVAVWYVGTVPEPSDPLLTVAHAVILDSRDNAEPRDLRDLLELVRRRTVVDLSWIRLQPWRVLLAGLFDAPAYRPYVTAVASAHVSGKSGPRHLLGGWLASQLHLERQQIRLTDARHVEITLECRLGNEVGTFDVGRVDGKRVLWAGATISDGPSIRQLTTLADDPFSASLAEALTHLEADRIWERSLTAATTLEV